ncbi:hypothetical protein BI343_11880 [Chromobacterium amazonense]|nr:hypothetical protein BI343_11880 [Chromobacterium amazonense]
MAYAGLQHGLPAPEISTGGDSIHSGHNRLHLLIDSTGIKIPGEGEWKTKKHVRNTTASGTLVQLSIDAETLEIWAIEVIDNSVGDAPMLPELLGQIPVEEPIASVGGDGAYNTKSCRDS